MKELRKQKWEDLKDYWVNDGPKVVFILFYYLANLAIFIERYYYYRWGGGSEYYPLLGQGLTWSRASAECITFNCAFLLFPVLRNVLSWLRGTFVNNYIPIDKNIIFHRHLAWMIAVFASIHCVAHFFNFNTIQSKDNVEELEPLQFDEVPTAWQLMFTTIAGTTGIVIVLLMVFMYSSALPEIRRPYFETFWFTHHLFILFYLLLAIHGAAAIITPPTFWIWCIGPATAYAIERITRLFRGSEDTILEKVIVHPSKVLELQMKKTSFKYVPGQYLFLNCPTISTQEWHPFTISSAPEEDFVSVHIRIVGDWTGQLWKTLNPQDMKRGISMENVLLSGDGLPILKIDGPFGAASEEFENYETLVLIGAGIGVTPFASILKSIRFRREREGSGLKMKKVYFFWISRDKSAFEWFNQLLAALERQNDDQLLSIQIYLTGGLSDRDELLNVMYADEDENDVITGLEAPTNFGRPNWKEIFLNIAANHPDEDVGVFFCGPAVLSKSLYKWSRKTTSTKEGGCRFHYNKENF